MVFRTQARRRASAAEGRPVESWKGKDVISKSPAASGSVRLPGRHKVGAFQPLLGVRQQRPGPPFAGKRRVCFLLSLARSSRSHGNSAPSVVPGGLPTSAAIANASPVWSARPDRTASRVGAQRTAEWRVLQGAWVSGMPDFLLLLWGRPHGPCSRGDPSFTGAGWSR